MKSFAIALLAVAAFSFSAIAEDVAPAVPQEGQKAPTFTLPSQDGSKISLDQYRGKWVVLYFYPKDMTSGCTIEAKAFESDQAKYAEKNATVVGVSLDTVDSHKEFCAKEGLNFKLLADTDSEVATKYGSLMTYQEKQYTARNTFLIDPSGTIRKVYLKVKPAGHSAEVLTDLAALQTAK